MGTYLIQERARASSLALKKFLWENRLLIALFIATTSFIAIMSPAFAADTLWNSGYSVSAKLVKYLKGAYCYTIFPPAAILTAIAIAITRDDKMLATLKKALITEVVVFFVVLGVDIVFNTVADLTNGVSGFDAGTKPAGAP